MSFIKSKYNNLSIKAKAGLWFTVCSFLQKGISFITVPIFTRLMTTEEYGTYSLYISWYQILIIFSSLYIFNGVLDNAMSKYEHDRDRFISSVQGLVILITFFLFGIYLVSANFWVTIFDLDNKYILLMFIEMMVAPAIYFWQGRQRFEYKYQRLVTITLCKSLLNPILGLLLVYNCSDRAFGRVTSIVIVELIFDFSIMAIQFIKGKCFFEKEYWKYSVTLAIPLIPHYLSGMILNQGDRVMIAHLVGKPEVALYSVAYSIGMLVQIFVSAVNSSVTPWYYSCFKSAQISEIKAKSRKLLSLITVIVVMLIFVSPEVVVFFGSSRYAEAVYVIPPVAVSVYFIFLYNILSFPEFYFEKTRFLMFASIGAALLNIALNFIFINLFGYLAAAYTTLVCYICYSLGHYYVGRKVLREYFPDSNLIDEKFIVVLSAILLIICFLSNFIIYNTQFRITVLLVFFIVILFNHNRIFKFITEIKGRK